MSAAVETGIPIPDLLAFARGPAGQTVALLEEAEQAAKALSVLAHASRVTQPLTGILLPSQFELQLAAPPAHVSIIDDPFPGRLALISVLLDEYQRVNGGHEFSRLSLAAAYLLEPTVAPFSRLRTQLLTRGEGIALIQRLVRVGELDGRTGSRAPGYFRTGPLSSTTRQPVPDLDYRYLRSLRPPTSEAGEHLSGNQMQRRSVVLLAVRAMTRACPDAVPSPFEFNPLASGGATGSDLVQYSTYARMQKRWNKQAAWRYADAARRALSEVASNWETAVLSDEMLVQAWRSIENMENTTEAQRDTIRRSFVFIASELSREFPLRASSVLDVEVLPTALPATPTGNLLIATTYNYRTTLGDIRLSVDQVAKMRGGVTAAIRVLDERSAPERIDKFSDISFADVQWLNRPGVLTVVQRRGFNSAVLLYGMVRHQRDFRSTEGSLRAHPSTKQPHTPPDVHWSPNSSGSGAEL